jgi:hypothetical protein
MDVLSVFITEKVRSEPPELSFAVLKLKHPVVTVAVSETSEHWSVSEI